MTRKLDLEDLIRGSGGREPRYPLPHPAKEKLAELAGGRLGEEEAEILREHLANCRRCQAILRVEHFDGAGAEDEPNAGSGERDAVLQAVVARLENRPVPAAQEVPKAGRPPRANRWLPLAAILAIVIGGFYLASQMRRAARLEQALAAAQKPFAVDVVSLLPRDFQVRNADPAPLNTISCPAEGTDLVWIVPTGGLAAEGKGVELTLLRAGLELWRGKLVASRRGTVDWRLPASFLSPGQLELRLEIAGRAEILKFDVQYRCPGP